jgi:acyl-coenzyme A thioesterase PaaI-like protein
MSIHFLLPAKQTSLRAVGRLLKPGKRQDIAEMHLYDGQDRLVGHAMGTFIVLPNVSLTEAVAAKHE